MKAIHLSIVLGVLLSACGGGDSSPPTPATSSDVSVVATAPAGGLQAGGSASFSVVVGNAGPDASGTIALALTATPGLSVATVTCVGAGGATCPAALGATMQLPSLPRNGSLNFTVQTAVSLGASGSQGVSAAATLANDPQAGNNSSNATSALAAGDLRNGLYQVYASNGQQYSLAINFDLQQLQLAGSGGSQQLAFTADASGGGFTVSGNQRFRTPPSLVVGGLDFGAGVVPFVAARDFVSSTAELSGSLNALALVLPSAGGASDSRIFAMQWAGTNLRLCGDNVIYTVSACPAGSLRTYALSVSGTEFTGADAVSGDTIKFRVARSGVNQVYLRSELTSDGTARRFTVALPDTNGLSAGNFVGADSVGRWGTVTLSPTSYAFSGVDAGGAAVSNTANSLVSIGPNGPSGIRVGTRTPDSANVFVIQSPVATVTIGARNGPATGVIQIAAP